MEERPTMSKSARADRVKKLVRENPGIRACEIADRTGVSKATVSLVVKALKDANEVEQVRDKLGRGFGLRPSIAHLRRRMVSGRWGG